MITYIQILGMNGLALLDELRSFDPALPVVVITAYGTVESAVQTLSRKKGSQTRAAEILGIKRTTLRYNGKIPAARLIPACPSELLARFNLSTVCNLLLFFAGGGTLIFIGSVLY